MLAYFSVSFLALVVSFFVYLKNPRLPLHKNYLFFTISIILWLSGVLLSQTPESLFEIHFRSLFGAALFMSYFLMLFIVDLVEKKISRRTMGVFVLINVGILAVSLGTTLITEIVTRDAVSRDIYVERGPLYVPAALWVLVYVFIAILAMLTKLKSGKMPALVRRQVRVVLISVVLAAIVGATTNILLPVLTQSTVYSNYAPITLLFLSLGFGYAIIRHRLLDIRRTVARAAAYILSLTLIAGIYGGAVYIIGEQIFGTSEATRTVERFIFITFAIITAAVFQPMKRLFDRLTNLVFYRDAYDPQQFLNELNKLLATSSDLDSLLMPSAKIIQDYLKVDFVLFGLREHEKVPRRIVGTTKKNFDEDDIDQLRQLTVSTQEQIIVSEHLRERKQELAGAHTILKIMDRYNIAVLARLADKRSTGEEGEGYLVLGPKKSGNLYNHQDIEMLEIIVNELVLAIQNALRFEEIEQFNETLQEKIYTATKELKKSNEKLKALDEAKDEFISMASHQLRTPLTSVKGYLSMLAEGDAGKLNETQKKFVDQSFVSAQRMVYLISDLLNVSRLKTGKFVIERVPTYLPTVIEDEISQLYETAASKGITISYEKPDKFPTLMLDETKIRQVVMNFCDNAIYYSPGGGKVTLELKEKGKQVEFTVTDTGMGVPKEVQHHLFTKFYRADNARKARPDGTGLGLFMAKKVTVAQGGSIIFKSVEGKGSTFGFSFPVNHHELSVPKTPEA